MYMNDKFLLYTFPFSFMSCVKIMRSNHSSKELNVQKILHFYSAPKGAVTLLKHAIL